MRHPRVATGVVLAAGALAAACASLGQTPRAEPPPAAAPSRAAVAGLANTIEVHGRHGRLDLAQRSALVARLGREGGASLLNRQLLAMAAQGGVQATTGNRARLLIDGPATFEAMFAAIEQARRSVLMQSYIVEDTAIAQRLASLLVRKRAQGVPVRLLYDAVGSIGTDQAFFAGLNQAGVPTCATNPVNPLQRPGYWDITHRDHRKILVVDRELGFTGGINISEVYQSGSGAGSFRRSAAAPAAARPDAAASAGWRDTQISLQGPASGALDDLVRSTWLAQGCQGDLPAVPTSPPVSGPPPGQQVVQIVPASPGDRSNRIYTLLLTAIDTAQRSVYLTMAYFAPGQDMVDALCDAAQRGVEVVMVLPARSDFAPVLHAGRSHYARLLAAGVKIHQLQDAVLHAKTAVIDGVVSTVGSSNMDWRSFTRNDEVNAVVFGEDFGDEMTRMFRQDVAASDTITLAAWQQRPLLQRVQETVAGWLERFW